MITIEMIDTGVKVATGVLLSGLFFLWIVRHREMNGEKRRDAIEHRRVMLQDVADQVGRVHHVYQQYLAIAMEYVRSGQLWPESRRHELRKMTDELIAVFKELNSAEATLLLLGEKKLEKALRVYGSRIVGLRRILSAERHQFSGEELASLDELKKEIQSLRETFYDALSDRFMTGLPA